MIKYLIINQIINILKSITSNANCVKRAYFNGFVFNRKLQNQLTLSHKAYEVICRIYCAQFGTYSTFRHIKCGITPE